jgi:hypothetical protein
VGAISLWVKVLVFVAVLAWAAFCGVLRFYLYRWLGKRNGVPEFRAPRIWWAIFAGVFIAPLVFALGWVWFTR